MNKAYKQYFDLIFGSTLLTLGIYLFVTPNGINFGGVIGLAQIIEIFLRRFIAIRSDANLVGMINFLINVPLFLIGYRVMSRRFCIKTMLSVAVQTLLLSVLPPLKAPLVEDVLLNSIFGAILCGVGVGYALRGSGCCGGMDIACMCLVKKYPDFKSGRLSIVMSMRFSFRSAYSFLIWKLRCTPSSLWQSCIRWQIGFTTRTSMWRP